MPPGRWLVTACRSEPTLVQTIESPEAAVISGGKNVLSITATLMTVPWARGAHESHGDGKGGSA
jgi:hypothetical protein